MLIFAQIVNSIIFLAIAGLHFYWAIGAFFGKKMVEATSVLPETNGKPLFVPSAFATLVVAIGLLIFAKISSYSIIDFLNFTAVNKYGNLAIAIIFFLRAIGDFKYVGFFKKKINGSKITSSFAQNDTKYYSPLCLFIAAMAIVIYLNQ